MDYYTLVNKLSYIRDEIENFLDMINSDISVLSKENSGMLFLPAGKISDNYLNDLQELTDKCKEYLGK